MRIASGYSLYIILFFLTSCGEKIEEFNGFLKSETERLLINNGSNEAKTWLLTEYQINGESAMTDCLDSVQLWFARISVDSLEIEGDFVFYLNNPGQCTVNNLCNDIPDICDLNAGFCEDNQKFCGYLDPNIIFAGSWLIPEPEVENGKVNTIVIDGPSGEIEYTFRYITSNHLELVATIEEEDERTEIFQKYIAE